MNRTVLGIDGGGTKTLAALVSEDGTLRGVGRGGSANYNAVGVETSQANIRDAVAEARRAAGLDASPFASAFLGVAGVVSARDHALVRGMAESLGLASADCVGVDHDCRIALAGGLAGRPGIVLIVGTGSSCFGVNAQDESWRAGGWGHLVSDEGSSYWLGVQAIAAAVAAYDGRGRETVLLRAVMDHLGIVEMDDILHQIYVPGLTKTEVAALAPLVIEAARADDVVACGLLSRGLSDLAVCVQAVAQHLRLDDCELTMVGGLLNAGDIVVQPLRKAILDRVPSCRFTEPYLPPVLGACLLALRQIGVTLPPERIDALRLALPL